MTDVSVAEPPRALSSRGLENLVAASRLLGYIRFFHPSDQAAALTSWDDFAIHVMIAAEDAQDPEDLAARLTAAFATIAPSLSVWAGGPEAAPPLPDPPKGARGLRYWRHEGAGVISEGTKNVYRSERIREKSPKKPDLNAHSSCFTIKSLGGGVTCRLPLKVYADSRGTLPRPESPNEWSRTKNRSRLTALNRSTRLAGVALCWGVMQHFYPYFDVVPTDWDEALTAALSKAAEDADESAYLRTLHELIAKLHDGHGAVIDLARPRLRMLPFALTWAGPDLVISGKLPSAPQEVKIGDVVLAVDGKPVEACRQELSRCISAATDAWNRSRVSGDFVTRLPTRDPATLRLRHPDRSEYDASVARVPQIDVKAPLEHRPGIGTEVAPGIVYFNLCGTKTDVLNRAMPELRKAKGIIFDLRGYPGSAAFDLMPHLIDDNATSARWNVPIVTLPDREGWTWHTEGRWSLKPLAPRLRARIAFLTDGRAISYAESIMGIVENYRMGEIVGAATAGTNGNVNPFTLPGGYRVVWTGMKVLKHDGSRHHGVGIHPTVPVEPTPQGIADGRDEVLEKALEVLQAAILN